MKVILCISKNNGMMFNNRRQSKDSVLLNKIIKTVNGETLYIQKYSEKLFSNYLLDNNIIVIENETEFTECKKDAYVFIEDPSMLQFVTVDEMVVCEWNRDYPADKFLEIDLLEFELFDSETIVGSSHDEITIKKYKR